MVKFEGFLAQLHSTFMSNVKIKLFIEAKKVAPKNVARIMFLSNLWLMIVVIRLFDATHMII